MVERILNYGAVYIGSMFKFIFGPLAGAKNLTVGNRFVYLPRDDDHGLLVIVDER